MKKNEELINLIKTAMGDSLASKFALYAGITQSALSKILNGHREPTPDTLKKIAAKAKNSVSYENLMVAAGYLVSAHPVDQNIAPARFDRNTIRIPVLGTIPAGVPIEAIEDINGYEDIPAEWANGGNEFFGLVVKGDSMEPKYLGGDVVIVRKQTDCENGQNCVVLVNGNEATLKKVIKHSNGITLQPINTKYEPVFYSQKEIASLPVTILGVIVQIRRDE